MDWFNISNFTNSSGLQDDAFNNSVGVTTKYNSSHAFSDYDYPFVSLISALGLPGNLLVIVVYARQLSTSTKVYMFALAVVDAIVCVCGIIPVSSATNRAILLTIQAVSEASMCFSMLLLAFVATERLMAVRRPHKFSLSTSRAKIALIPIAVASTVYTLSKAISRFLHYKLLSRMLIMIITFGCVLVMVICYIAMAKRLWKQAKSTRESVGVESGTVLSASIQPTASTSVQESEISSKTASKEAAKKSKNNKGICIVFAVTVVFIVCWIPKWLHYVEVHILDPVVALYLVNFGINPLIYLVMSSMFRNDVQQFYRQTRADVIACFR